MNWNNINKPLFRIEIFLYIQRTSTCWINIRFLTFLVDNLYQQKQLNCLVNICSEGLFRLKDSRYNELIVVCFSVCPLI